MDRYEDKINLLAEMIAFSIVDGKLHQREYEFIALIAKQLNVDKASFNDLFHQELPKNVIKSELQRIQQFYRLALLMHIDGVLHEKEEVAIKQIAINMALNPVVTKRILTMIKMSPTHTIDPDYLMEAFKEQHN
ncbi:MAG TPA: excinuclease ABC subunit B [Flavobacterium sp.]|jgi:hypothetical protein